MEKGVKSSRKALSLIILMMLLVSTLPLVFAAKFNLGDTVEVFNTGALGLLVRKNPAGDVIGKKYDGDRGMIIDGPRSVSLGGVVYTWWMVRWGDNVGLEGWSAEGYPGGDDYLKYVYISPSTKFSIGDLVKVYNTGGVGLKVRSDPPELKRLEKVNDDTVGKVVGGPFYGVGKYDPSYSYEPGFYYFWKVDYLSIVGRSAEDWLTKVVGEPTITSSLVLVESPPYYVGETVTAKFTIKNKADAQFTFDVLTVGGRDPDGQVADFTWRTGITLNPSASYNYQGTLTLTKVGNYHFFCAYRTPWGDWNTAIPTEGGATNTLNIYVPPPNQPFTLYNGYVSPSSGDTSTTFSYYVTYSDPEGDVPTLKYVYIDYSPYTMVKISGDYVSGAVFKYSTTLSTGTHNFYFYFEDAVHGHTKRLPPTGTYSGPNVPDFSIAASPALLTIQQGSLGTSTITITSINGFNQPVQLSVSGVPSEVTATLSPSQVTPPAGGTATSTLTVSVATTATPGSYPLTVTGTSGALTHSTYISLKIPPPVNQPPVASNLAISPSSPRTTDNLVGSYAYSDADGDPESGSEIRWYKDAVLQSAYNDKLTIPSSATAKGQVWYFTVKPKDGTDFGALQTSPSVTIQNSLPTAPVVDVTPDSPVTTDDLVCTITSPSTDLDGDTITYTYEWYKDGVIQNAETTVTTALTDTVSSTLTAEGQVWKCVVTPNDGMVNGISDEDQVTIVPPTPPPNQPPALNNGYVTPSSGDTSTVFEYYVTYADPDGDAPTVKYVYIDGSPYTMTKIAGDYVSGATFRYSTTLPAGSQNYYFYFDDGYGHTVRLPISGTYSGPNVRAPSAISITLSSTTITLGESVTISGAINPVRPHVSVTILYRLSGGEAWSTLTTVTTDSNSHYSYTWTPGTASTYEVKARWEGDETTLGAESEALVLVVEEAPPPAPKIDNIDPRQPIAFGYQHLTIIGEGFVPDSYVNFSDGINTYRIPRERTRFIDSNKIEVVAGFGYTEGSWEVWVINPDGSQSNKKPFDTRKASDDEIMKVLLLALDYTKPHGEWTFNDAVIMTAIAGGESGWNPNAAGDLVEHWGTLWDTKRRYDPNINSIGSCSWGLWQILMPAHIADLKKLANTDNYDEIAKWLRDPRNNVKVAYNIWRNRKLRVPGSTGFEPWSAFTSGDYKDPEIWNRVTGIAKRISIFKSPVNVTITDEYGRIISEIENQIPGASYEYFNVTDAKIFYLPLNLTYHVEINATAYGNITIIQITPRESIYEIAFSQATFDLTSETVAQYDLLPFNANYTLEVDENGDGMIDYELIPEVETLTTEYDIGIVEIVPLETVVTQGDTLLINVTIMNYGIYIETFNITIYANETVIAVQTITLANGTFTTYTFTWNTLGFALGNCTISAYADPLPGETETTDNENVDGVVQILPSSIFYTFSIVWGEETFIVSVESNSTVSNFAFNQPDKEISFNVTGEVGTVGFCNVTIPKELLYGEPWTVLIDGAPLSPIITENETHSFLYFTCPHSTHKIQIIGTRVIRPPPTPLSVSINPLSVSILVGQSVTFTSTVSGGVTPYTYQWYLNGNPVSGATSDTWTFTPTTSGIYYVYLKVTDDTGNTTQSETARITITTVPVGGYSVPIQLPTTAKPATLHIALLTILTAIFITIKRKTKRKH